MAAIVRPIQRQVVTQASSPVAVRPGQTAVGELGQGLADVGTMFDEWQDGIDTAAATNADAQMSDRIRDMLYADGDGFMYSLGGDTMNRRGDVTSALDELQRDVTADLNPAARMKANSSINARYQRALQTIDQHTAGQRTAYMNDAADARITTSINDAIADPSKAFQSININRTTILDQAAANGWSQEQTELALKESRTGVYSGIIDQLANADPIAALNYLRDHQHEMTGSEVEKLNSALMPAAKAYEGRLLGQSVFNSTNVQSGSVTLWRDGISAVESRGSGDYEAVGKVMTSGSYEGDRAYGRYQIMGRNIPEWSLKHLGREVTIEEFMANPEIQDEIFDAEFGSYVNKYGNAQDAASMWFTGRPLSEGANRSDGNINGAEYVRRFNEAIGGTGQTSTYEDILAEEDPLVRASALSELGLLTSAKNREQEAMRQAVEDEAFRVIESGGSPQDLPFGIKQSLGVAAMTSLMNYATKIGQVKTDDEFYNSLLEMQAVDPDSFMLEDPMVWRDKLNDADWHQLSGNRADLIGGKAAPGNLTITQIRTASSTAWEAAGLTDGKETYGVADSVIKSAFEANMLRWGSDFTKAEGRIPLPEEINTRINNMLVPIVMNPAGGRSFAHPLGGGDKQKGFAFQIDYTGDTGEVGDSLTVDKSLPPFELDMNEDAGFVHTGGIEFPRNYALDVDYSSGKPAGIPVSDFIKGSLKINGVGVPRVDKESFAQEFFDRYGIAPTVEQLVNGMISLGKYK